MLIWALAAIIPVLLHFWNQHRYQDVPWAAMEYLLVAVRDNARRLRVEQLILLLVRISILLLLAMALANPILSALPGLTGGLPNENATHTVLVLDASYSMDYRAVDQTCFEQAKTIATRITRASRQGDGFTLICMAAPPRVIIGEAAFDPNDVISEIQRLQRTDGGANLLATCAEIEKVLDLARRQNERLKRNRVCFFTDLGRSTWGQSTIDAGRVAIDRLSKSAKIELYDVGHDGASNVAVVGMTTRQPVATVARPISIDVQLESFGTRRFGAVPVTVLVDGQQIAAQRVAIPAGGQATVSVAHRFVMPGDHVLEARVDGDRLEADNRRWFSLGVRSALRVLCIEGKPGAAANVALALEPGPARTPRIRPVVRSESALLDEDLEQFSSVFICNVARFGRRQADLLRSCVRRGGGVVLFLGDQVDAENYNRLMTGDGAAQELLPARLGAAVATGAYSFDPLGYRHPIVMPFRGNEQAGLLTTPVWKYIRLEPRANSAAEVALRFQTGDPAILTQAVGRGRVILVATAASEKSVDIESTPPVPWTALPIWPSFPPLIQEMLNESLAGSAQNRNLQVGDPIEATLPSTAVAPWVTITNPAGARQRVAIQAEGGREQCFYPDTDRCGVYRLQWDTAEAAGRAYAVNLITRESQVDRLDPVALPRAFRAGQTAVEDTAAAVPAAAPAALFRYLLAIVLVLVLLETFLAWFFGKEAFSP